MENQIKQTSKDGIRTPDSPESVLSKKKLNWFQKKFSSRNGEDNLPKQGTYEAAVAAAAIAIQSVEDVRTTKLKRGSFKKENGRNGRTTTQFSLKKNYAVEKSKDKPMKHRSKELERVHSFAKPTSQNAAIPIAPQNYAEWYDKLKSVVVCGK